jgi:hypothetical protein
VKSNCLTEGLARRRGGRHEKVVGIDKGLSLGNILYELLAGVPPNRVAKDRI